MSTHRKCNGVKKWVKLFARHHKTVSIIGNWLGKLYFVYGNNKEMVGNFVISEEWEAWIDDKLPDKMCPYLHRLICMVYIKEHVYHTST